MSWGEWGIITGLVVLVSLFFLCLALYTMPKPDEKRKAGSS